MKKTSLSQFIISENSQLVAHALNALHVKVTRAKGKRKNIVADTLLLAKLSNRLVSEKHIPLINPPHTELYLDDATHAIQRYNLELLIKDQNKAFDKAASKYNRLEEKGKILEKKKMDIEGKIQKNQHQLQFRIVEVAAKRHQLAVSFGKRDNNIQVTANTIKV